MHAAKWAYRGHHHLTISNHLVFILQTFWKTKWIMKKNLTSNNLRSLQQLHSEKRTKGSNIVWTTTEVQKWCPVQYSGIWAISVSEPIKNTVEKEPNRIVRYSDSKSLEPSSSEPPFRRPTPKGGNKRCPSKRVKRTEDELTALKTLQKDDKSLLTCDDITQLKQCFTFLSSRTRSRLKPHSFTGKWVSSFLTAHQHIKGHSLARRREEIYAQNLTRCTKTWLLMSHSTSIIMLTCTCTQSSTYAADTPTCSSLWRPLSIDFAPPHSACG